MTHDSLSRVRRRNAGTIAFLALAALGCSADPDETCETLVLESYVDARASCVKHEATTVMFCRAPAEPAASHCMKRSLDGALFKWPSKPKTIPSEWQDCSEDEALLRDVAGPCTADGHDLVLVNKTDGDLYFQLIDVSRNQPSIAVSVGGTRVRFQGTCEVCSCDTCAKDCGVCGRALAKVQRIPAGGSYVYPWGGNVWRTFQGICPLDQLCERAIGAPQGEVIVRVEYSEAYDVVTDFGSHDELIRPPTRTQSVSFLYEDGVDTIVELR